MIGRPTKQDIEKFRARLDGGRMAPANGLRPEAKSLFQAHARLAFEPLSEIRRVQQDLLTRHLEYTLRHSPYYRGWVSELGLNLNKLWSAEDLSVLPLTDKRDLARHNQDFQAVSDEKVVDIVFSSGTSGIPTRVVYTERDLQRLAYNEHQSLAAAGVGAKDTVLLTCTMDRCFIAGLAYFLGLRSLGAAAVRNGHGTMAGHQEIIRRLSPSVLVGVPSFLLKLGRYLQADGVDPSAAGVRTLVCIGEPLRDRFMQPLPVTEQLQQLWAATVCSTYASSEIVTTFCECGQQCGGHLHPDLAILEIVDAQGCPLPVGEVGEVVVTPLAVEAMPLLRFRTGDLSMILDEPCPCGRNTIRLGPILTRRDQMLKVRGTTLYPGAIAAALDQLPEVEEHYLEVTSGQTLSDQVTVHVAVSGTENGAEKRIVEKLQTCLRVKLEVVVEPLSVIRAQVFSRNYRKPMRFLDRRKAE